MQCFFKTKYIKSRTFNDKIGELLRKIWSLRSCFLILPPGALTLQGAEGVLKRELSKHWCTLQWCASRGWFIAHANWTSCKDMTSFPEICLGCILLPYSSCVFALFMIITWNYLMVSHICLIYGMTYDTMTPFVMGNGGEQQNFPRSEVLLN